MTQVAKSVQQTSSLLWNVTMGEQSERTGKVPLLISNNDPRNRQGFKHYHCEFDGMYDLIHCLKFMGQVDIVFNIIKSEYALYY